MKKRTLERRNAADLEAVLKMPQGRRLLWRILQAAQLEHHGFVPSDPYATAFHCGQKSLGLLIQNQILEIVPLMLAQMRTEHQSEVISQQKEIEREQEEFNDA